MILGAGLLTWRALSEDKANSVYQAGVRQSRVQSERIVQLAEVKKGFPEQGALRLLREDPFTQGPKLFAAHCASCHRYDGHDGLGGTPTDEQTAPDLAGFASREWLEKFLDPDGISSPRYFGGTRFKDGKMARFVKKDLANLSPEGKAQLQKVIAALSAEAGLPYQADLERNQGAIIQEGQALAASETMRCTECHQFRKKDEDATAPDLTGYGSKQWLVELIGNPAHERFYGKRNDRMPAFREAERLDDQSLGLIADWLRRDYVPPRSVQAPTR